MDKQSLSLFIPSRLEIEGKPNLSFFPYNVFIMRYCNYQGKPATASVTYNPAFETLKESEAEQSMDYLNIYNPIFRLHIIYKKQKGSYSCEKYQGNKLLGISGGSSWNGFFTHVGLLEFEIGETCFFEPIPEWVASVATDNKEGKKNEKK